MKEIKSKYMVDCPKCNQKAILKTLSSQMVSFGVISLFSFGVSLCIPIIGWICAPIFFFMGIILLILSLIAKFKGSATIVCYRCHSKFKLTNEEYKNIKSS